jgi:hypothetical protein
VLGKLVVAWESCGLELSTARISNQRRSTDRLQVKFFVQEEWRAQDAVDAKLISSIDTERLGTVWIDTGSKVKTIEGMHATSFYDR